MALKEYTAEEACGLMPIEPSKREKRFIMKQIKKAAKRGQDEISLPLECFNCGNKVLENYLHKFKYCTYVRRIAGEIDIFWRGAAD